MLAYIITLKDANCPSNKYLFDSLLTIGLKPNFIVGINGSELGVMDYYFAIQTYFHNNNRILSPSELGCALGHKKAYHELLSSGEKSALILEDDAILDTGSIEYLRLLALSDFPNKGFVHLGGQQGLEEIFSNVRGNLINEYPKIFKINNEDLECLYRTVGYFISAPYATELLNLLDNHAFTIDDFKYILAETNIANFYYTNIIKHPVCLNNSSIQIERSAMMKNNPSKKNDPSLRLIDRLTREVMKTISYRVYKSKFKLKFIYGKTINEQS